jgi:hypothetical protein
MEQLKSNLTALRHYQTLPQQLGCFMFHWGIPGFTTSLLPASICSVF